MTAPLRGKHIPTGQRAFQRKLRSPSSYLTEVSPITQKENSVDFTASKICIHNHHVLFDAKSQDRYKILARIKILCLALNCQGTCLVFRLDSQ